MEFSERTLQQALALREGKRLTYAAIAEQLFHDKSQADRLRSALRTYKKVNDIHTILDPVGKLFGEALTIPYQPTLIISDTHAPYQNKELLMKAFGMAQSLGIKQLIHGGDLIDAASYNSQAKGEVNTPIDTDIEHARSILYAATNYFNQIILVPGNHDYYYLKKADINFGRFIREMVLLERYGHKFTTTEYDYLYLDNFAVIGHLSSGYDMTPGKVAANIAMKYGMHALVGHDHLRGAMIAPNGKWGLSIGGMFMPGSFWYKMRSYNTFPDSMLGFVIIRDNKIYQYDDVLHETVYE